jgi:hypothetical protein
MFDAFIHHTAAKAWFYNLRDLVTVLRADGKRLPIRDNSVDAGYCIGAPSIVGLHECLGELARAVRSGGHVVVSDAVWRTKPSAALGKEWQWVAEMRPISAQEYALEIETAGLRVERTHMHDRGAWEEYFAPMLAVAEAAKLTQPADIFFADEVESAVALERRAADAFLDYATFVARKP